MRALRFARGNKALRELELAATKDGVSFLPRSSLGAVLSGTRMPSKTLLLTFVKMRGGVKPGTPAALQWEQAWERADAYRRGEPIHTAGHLQQPEQIPEQRVQPDAIGFRSRSDTASATRRGRPARRPSQWRRLASRLPLQAPQASMHHAGASGT
ncbi:hypothetical protein ABT072_44515 [Streptomyces sp. NPDC002589]|uniref:hypothetical protein n=1 Tax=Streptomyces sp. NPDC002589 TaxID=3154420 RepID=UPI00332D7CC0